MTSKNILKILLVLSSIYLGFIQEQVKININYQLERGATIPGFFDMSAEQRITAAKADAEGLSFDYYYNHQRIPYLYTLSQSSLAKLKWVLTVFFVALFFCLNIFLLKIFTGSHQFARLMAWMYALAFIVAFVIYISGVAFETRDVSYSLARRIIGVLQSVIPAVVFYIYFLLPMFRVNQKKRTHETHQ